MPCADCGRPYGDEYGFPDLVVADSVWEKIKPEKGNLLCPSCMCHRAYLAGLEGVKAVFTSGPFVTEKNFDAKAKSSLERS